MPSEKVLIKKKKQVDKLKSEFEGALVGVLVSYKGINVVSDTALRKDMRENNVSYRVVKNTLLKRAFELSSIVGMDEFLSGSSAIATCNDSYSMPSKIICKFIKENDFFSVKAGFLEGKVIASEEIKALATLPSREELISHVLRGLNTPIAALAMVSNGIIRSFALVINAIAQKKSAA